MARPKKKEYVCADKIRFESEEDAREDAAQYGNFVWKCGWCPGYHRGREAMYGYSKEWVPKEENI